MANSLRKVPPPGTGTLEEPGVAHNAAGDSPPVPVTVATPIRDSPRQDDGVVTEGQEILISTDMENRAIGPIKNILAPVEENPTSDEEVIDLGSDGHEEDEPVPVTKSKRKMKGKEKIGPDIGTILLQRCNGSYGWLTSVQRLCTSVALKVVRRKPPITPKVSSIHICAVIGN